MDRHPRLREPEQQERGAPRVSRIVLDDFDLLATNSFFDLSNEDAIPIPLVFRVERQPVPAFPDQPSDFLQTRIAS